MTEPSTPRRLPDGFLERGGQVTRLEAFVDAAFAFAVTLLVISLDAIPDSIPALVEAIKGVPAFAASFAQIALFWHAHAGWSKRYGMDDPASTLLGLALVFLVLVYVYPLKIVYGSLFHWISGGSLPSPARIASLGDLSAMFTIYGVAFATLSACIAALYLHAWRHRARLTLDEAERRATRSSMVVWAWSVLVALLSIAAAQWLAHRPQAVGWQAGTPGLVYFLMSFSRLVVHLSERRYQAAGRS